MLCSVRFIFDTQFEETLYWAATIGLCSAQKRTASRPPSPVGEAMVRSVSYSADKNADDRCSNSSQCEGRSCWRANSNILVFNGSPKGRWKNARGPGPRGESCWYWFDGACYDASALRPKATYSSKLRAEPTRFGPPGSRGDGAMTGSLVSGNVRQEVG